MTPPTGLNEPPALEILSVMLSGDERPVMPVIWSDDWTIKKVRVYAVDCFKVAIYILVCARERDTPPEDVTPSSPHWMTQISPRAPAPPLPAVTPLSVAPPPPPPPPGMPPAPPASGTVALEFPPPPPPPG